MDVAYLLNLMLNEVPQRVTTYPGTGQVVTTHGANCKVHDWLLMCYITSIIITQGCHGTFRGDFSICNTFNVDTKID